MAARVWNLVFLVGFVAYCAIRGVYQRRTRGNEMVDLRKDRAEKVLLFVVFVGNLLLPVIYILTPWLGFADYRLPKWGPWLGVVVMILALWLFWRDRKS